MQLIMEHIPTLSMMGLAGASHNGPFGAEKKSSFNMFLAKIAP